MKTVHIVGGDFMVEKMFLDRGYTAVEEPGNADLLCFTGGADVTPNLYGDIQHQTTRCNLARDLREQKVFNEFLDVPKVGICRGSQFLNAMSGGTLWQDVDNHAIGNTHEMYFLSDRSYDYAKVAKGNIEGDWHYSTEVGNSQRIQVTSTHHQMMRVDKKTAEVWGVTFLSRYRDRGPDVKKRADFNFSPDVEIANYLHTKSLCFQPHPEYGVKSCEEVFFLCLERAYGW